jgi:Tryptophan-rich Synechocystis species C-terminal domain/Putative esterase
MCQQDLKGNGAISVPTPAMRACTVIETDASTSLIECGSTYFVQPAGKSAVELSFGGSPVVDGEFDTDGGHWGPIAAKRTETGYEVAWKAVGADEYTVWYTDASGNCLSSPLVSASGSSAAMESLEASFRLDLNGDGVIGVNRRLRDQPEFVYEGTDSSGAQLYDVTWNKSGSHSFAVRVLTPTRPSTDYPHSFLFDLPVEPGLAQSRYRSGLDELAKLGVENEYNTTIIEPIFPLYPWYADNPNDETIDYETFVASVLAPWANGNLSTSRSEKALLIGFSKSGYGALDLLLKHPDTFAAAAAFDFPGNMTTNDDYGASANYGTQVNFQDNYQLTGAFIDKLKAPFATQARILISEGPVFESQVADFDALLTARGVAHTLLAQRNYAHSWSGGWLPDAVAGLFALASLSDRNASGQPH